MKKTVGLLLCISLLGCEQQNSDVNQVETAPNKTANLVLYLRFTMLLSDNKLRNIKVPYTCKR